MLQNHEDLAELKSDIKTIYPIIRQNNKTHTLQVN